MGGIHCELMVMLKTIHRVIVVNPCDRFSTAHQCHNVIGQVTSQIRSHKTREASESNTCVILVGAAEILGEKRGEKREEKSCQGDELLAW